MGLLDSLIAGALKGAANQLDASAFPAVLAQLLGGTDLGGAKGLLDRLRAAGLGHEVDSWLGSGSNLPVSAEQLRRAIGPGQAGQIAQGAGISVEELLDMFARQLPQAIDSMSPNGDLDDSPAEVNQGAGDAGGGTLADQAGIGDIGDIGRRR